MGDPAEGDGGGRRASRRRSPKSSRPSRRASRRARRGRQLRARVRTRQRRGGVCAGVAAGAACAAPAAHRCAHRRGPVARRGQLHGPDHQPHGAATGSGARRPDGAVRRDVRFGRERLPDGVWLRELGTHPLRDLPRPERVVQLCHPDLCNEFPPLRTRKPLQRRTFRLNSPASSDAVRRSST